MPKVVPHHWPHRYSHTTFYEGNYGNHYFTPLPHKMPLAFFIVPQTYVTRYPIIDDERLKEGLKKERNKRKRNLEEKKYEFERGENLQK